MKQYRLVFDKRVVNVATKSSYPYGYERIGKEVDLLLDLYVQGVTSLGRRTRPACNQGLLESPLNKKMIFFQSKTVCFSLTSGNARGLGLVLSVGACAVGLCLNALI